MSRPLPPLNWLHTFECVARLGSVTLAGNELCISPSAVSQQVKQLERLLDVKLFTRQGNALQLTDSGRDCLPVLSEAFTRIGTAVNDMRSETARGTLNVSVAPSVSSKWLIHRLATFHRRYPDIDLCIYNSMNLVDFFHNTDEIDIAIRYGPGLYPKLCATHLMDEEIIAVCNPDTMRKHGPFQTPHDIASLRLIHDSSPEQDRSCPDWAAFFSEFGIGDIDTNGGLFLNQSSQVVDAVANGDGVALVKRVLAASDIAAGRLVPLFNWSAKVAFGYHVVFRQERLGNPKINSFLTWIKGEAADMERRAVEPVRARQLEST